MNSVYKKYALNTILLYAILLLFSLFYLQTYRHSEFFNSYTFVQTLYFLDIIFVYILCFILYRDVNKKTGVFLNFMPCKKTNLFIFKTLILIAFIFLALGLHTLLGLRIVTDYFSSKDCIYHIKELYIILIIEASVITLSLNIVGMPNWGLAAPIIVFFCLLCGMVGFGDFLLYALPESIKNIIQIFYIEYFSDFLRDIIDKIFSLNSATIFSIVLFIISGLLNKYSDSSNTGRMFRFQKMRIPVTILMSFLGGFSLYAIVISYIHVEDRTITIAGIIALICIVISYKVFSNICKHYD